jgi:hypothetical protein
MPPKQLTLRLVKTKCCLSVENPDSYCLLNFFLSSKPSLLKRKPWASLLRTNSQMSFKSIWWLRTRKISKSSSLRRVYTKTIMPKKTNWSTMWLCWKSVLMRMKNWSRSNWLLFYLRSKWIAKYSAYCLMKKTPYFASVFTIRRIIFSQINK